ncbi:hypothetical protein ACN28S_14190 [Cystobacter fuscus]
MEAEQPQLAAAARTALTRLMPPRESMRALLESAERDELRRWFGEDQAPARTGKADGARPEDSSADELLADLAFSCVPSSAPRSSWRPAAPATSTWRTCCPMRSSR